jgi:hypothetical protein
MVYQNSYRGVPIPDSMAGGNIFPIPGPSTRQSDAGPSDERLRTVVETRD